MSFTESQKFVRKSINLLVTLDRNYIDPLTVMLRSYSEHHRDTATDLYVVHSSLEASHFSLIEKAVDNPNIHIHNVKITEKCFSDIPVLERLPEESFYRLLAFEFLPEDVERCLYLDPDIYIRKPLTEFYETDMDGAYIAAASHLHGLHNRFNLARLSLGGKRYINSGVMLMNLRKIREDFSTDTVLECLKKNTQRLIMGDQDLINILFGEHTLLADERIYNLDERTYGYYHKKENFDLSDVEEKTAVIHYNGKYKPWLAGYKGELDRFYPEVENKGPAPAKTVKSMIKSVYNITRLNKAQKTAAAGILLFIAACVFSYVFLGREFLKVISEPAVFRRWLDKMGAFDELVFILLRAAQTVVKFIPAEPLEIAAGYAWGAVPGMIYCIIGNMLGSAVVLALTKKFGEKIIRIFLPSRGTKTMKIFNSSDRIYPLLFILYLIPGLPKDGFTYFAGIIPVKFLPFMLITSVARIPSVLSSTICGATLANKQYLVSAIVFAATIILAALGGLSYRLYLKKKTDRVNEQ